MILTEHAKKRIQFRFQMTPEQFLKELYPTKFAGFTSKGVILKTRLKDGRGVRLVVKDPSKGDESVLVTVAQYGGELSHRPFEKLHRRGSHGKKDSRR